MKPEAKPRARHLPEPATLGERLARMRFTIARRFVQLSILLLFVGTARWGWKAAGVPILSGNLSASKFLETIPMTDPLALLERLAAGHLPQATAALGALIVLLIYGTLGSRTFCGWVCPMNIVTELGSWLRDKLGLPADEVRHSRKTRYATLAGALIASFLTGTAAFDVVSPQALLWRDLVFGTGLGALSAALAIFALELALFRDGWCGHLCPLGGFWTLTGKAVRHAAVRIVFDAEACTHCGDCLRVCPERQIIRFKDLEKTGRIPTGECINCGRCIAICPEKALKFQFFGQAVLKDCRPASLKKENAS